MFLNNNCKNVSFRTVKNDLKVLKSLTRTQSLLSSSPINNRSTRFSLYFLIHKLDVCCNTMLNDRIKNPDRTFS